MSHANVWDPGSDRRARIRATGAIELDGTPDHVFPLFTPEGERTWVAGWDPRYPASAVPSEEPGSTFLTHNRGSEAIWVVVDRDETDYRARYVSVMPGLRTSLITVELEPVGAERTRVRVTYDVTSLSERNDEGVLSFGGGYDEMLEEWKRWIESSPGSSER
jgi:hypothetical protein